MLQIAIQDLEEDGGLESPFSELQNPIKSDWYRGRCNQVQYTSTISCDVQKIYSSGDLKLKHADDYHILYDLIRKECVTKMPQSVPNSAFTNYISYPTDHHSDHFGIYN